MTLDACCTMKIKSDNNPKTKRILHNIYFRFGRRVGSAYAAEGRVDDHSNPPAAKKDIYGKI